MDFESSKSLARIIISFLILSHHATNGGIIQRYDEDLHEDDECGLDPSTYSGKCRKTSECVNLFIESQNKVEICSFGEEILICCSDEDFSKSQRVNGPLDYDSCAIKYKNLRKTEPTLKLLTHNGDEVEAHEFSHIAAIGWLSWFDFSVSWNCAGNLITEKFVVSAGHCMSYDGNYPNVVRFGDIDLNSSDDDEFVQQFGIKDITIHPEYDAGTHANDIALIKLLGSVVPTQSVVPACIRPLKSPPEYLKAAGYGQDGDGLHTNKLLKVYLKRIEMEKCQAEQYPNIPLSVDSQICAESFRVDENEQQDLCYGDSGAGLQYYSTDLVENDELYKIPTLTALTSFGMHCALTLPSIYVNISFYYDWMENVIKSSDEN